MLISTMTAEGPGVARLRDDNGQLVLRYTEWDYEVLVDRGLLLLVHNGREVVVVERLHDVWHARECSGDVTHSDKHGIEAAVGVLRQII